MEKKLSICIPTFNRDHFLQQLLVFIENELDSLSCELASKIEIIIGDNCSVDSTQEVCLNSSLNKNGKYSFLYIKNTKNKGIVGNLISIVKQASGEYIWFVGDDDIYNIGILQQVIRYVMYDLYEYIFINHRSYAETPDDGTGLQFAIKELPEMDDYQKDTLLDIFNFSGTSLMFISAQIHRKKNIMNALNFNIGVNSAYPLFLSFYSASCGKIGIIHDVWIDNVWRVISWKEEASKIFLLYIPRILYVLPQLGYSYKRSRKILLKYVFSKRNFYFYYLGHRIKRFFDGE